MCIYIYINIIILYYISSRFSCNVQTNTEIPDVFTTMLLWSHGHFPLNDCLYVSRQFNSRPSPNWIFWTGTMWTQQSKHSEIQRRSQSGLMLQRMQYWGLKLHSSSAYVSLRLNTSNSEPLKTSESCPSILEYADFKFLLNAAWRGSNNCYRWSAKKMVLGIDLGSQVAFGSFVMQHVCVPMQLLDVRVHPFIECAREQMEQLCSAWPLSWKGRSMYARRLRWCIESRCKLR